MDTKRTLEVIEGTCLSNKCDYSFGDHLGAQSPNILKGGFSRPANPSNHEFIVKCKEFEGKIMTLFIDNIRLYSRNIMVKEIDIDYIKYLLSNNDLLALCAEFPKNKFIIFTSHEDTPIDDKIVISSNVLGIYAVNAEYFNDKVHPFPYGVQRKIDRPGDPIDNRIQTLTEEIDKPFTPTKLLYINCGVGRNESRKPLLKFKDKDWVTTRFNEDSMYYRYDRYIDYLNELRDHKFIVCPEGHGLDCHRDWETLYMRRIPVMKRTPYFEALMDGFPVLFVDRWEDITEELLLNSDSLYQEAHSLDLSRLDLDILYNGIVKSYA